MSMIRATRGRLRVGLLASVVLALGVSVPHPVAAASSGGWNSLGQGATPGSPPLDGPVYTQTRVGSDLYLGGNFTNAGGNASADYVAKWTGSAWAAVGPGLTGSVYAVAVDGSRVFVGGGFQNAGGDPEADGLAVWNGSAWSDLGFGSSDLVLALTIVGRKLFIGGAFDNMAGNIAADGIAAYDLDTGVWSALTDENEDIGGTVHAIVPDGAGGLFVGGGFTNADEIEAADRVARWSGGTTWSALGGLPINGFVRGLHRSGSDLYVVGDFTNLNGIDAADKLARYDGTWHSVGSTSVFTEGNNSLYDVAVDGSNIFVAGNFLNAGGDAEADAVAVFSNGAWSNVGTNADGSNGPAGELRVLEIVGPRLYAAGIANIGGISQNASSAWYRMRQPDGRIKTTGSFIGNDVYNANGNDQTKNRNANQGATATFTLGFGNDGYSSDTFTVLGAGSGGGFKAKYFDGATNITAQVVTGTYSISSLAPGASKTITLEVKVGNGVANGATRSFLVTATSTGGGAAKDAVKAKVTAT